jgi:hypothetical protein
MNAIKEAAIRDDYAVQMEFLRAVPLDLQDTHSGIDLTGILKEIIIVLRQSFPHEAACWEAQAQWRCSLPASFNFKSSLTEIVDTEFTCTKHNNEKVGRKRKAPSATKLACISKHEAASLRLWAHALSVMEAAAQPDTNDKDDNENNTAAASGSDSSSDSSDSSDSDSDSDSGSESGIDVEQASAAYVALLDMYTSFLMERLTVHGRALRAQSKSKKSKTQSGESKSVEDVPSEQGVGDCNAYLEWLINRLLTILTSEIAQASEELIVTHSELLTKLGDTKTALKVLHTGVQQEGLESSEVLWHALLEQETTAYQKLSKKSATVRRKAFQALLSLYDTAAQAALQTRPSSVESTPFADDVTGASLKLIQDHILDNSLPVTAADLTGAETAFKAAVTLNPVVFKACYVEFAEATLSEFKTIHGAKATASRVNKAVGHVLATPKRTIELYQACAQQCSSITDKIRVFEKAVAEHGAVSVELWLAYIHLLRLQENVTQLNRVIWRAGQVLVPQLKADFSRALPLM